MPWLAVKSIQDFNQKSVCILVMNNAVIRNSLQIMPVACSCFEGIRPHTAQTPRLSEAISDPSPAESPSLSTVGHMPANLYRLRITYACNILPGRNMSAQAKGFYWYMPSTTPRASRNSRHYMTKSCASRYAPGPHSTELSVIPLLYQFVAGAGCCRFRSFHAYLELTLCTAQDADAANVPVIIVGNKCDLESKRQVSSADVQEYAKLRGCLSIESSAKSNINISEAFVDLVKSMRQILPKVLRPTSSVLSCMFG